MKNFIIKNVQFSFLFYGSYQTCPDVLRQTAKMEDLKVTQRERSHVCVCVEIKAIL